MHALFATLRRRITLSLVALPFFAPASSATWSIGVGGAAAQSVGDASGQNRIFIRARMQAGFSPRWILTWLPTIDNQHAWRQYGIVTLAHHAMTWTGANVGAARAGVNGNYVSDDGGLVRYAIQGNVLTGDVVVDAARHALVNTPGDLSQKVMAAMEAAREKGGDGRCSCSPSNPTGCGAPPDDFDKSSHVAFITLARLGDVDGTCSAAVGCANGDYFLDLQRSTPIIGPDPVIELRGAYADWRGTLVGRPDHVRSTTSAADASLPADGSAQTTVSVQLVDIEGDALMNGGALLTVEWTGVGPQVATPGPISDHGGGHYSFELTATTTNGPGSWKVTVDDGLGAVRLWPDVHVDVL